MVRIFIPYILDDVELLYKFVFSILPAITYNYYMLFEFSMSSWTFDYVVAFMTFDFLQHSRFSTAFKIFDYVVAFEIFYNIRNFI